MGVPCACSWVSSSLPTRDRGPLAHWKTASTFLPWRGGGLLHPTFYVYMVVFASETSLSFLFCERIVLAIYFKLLNVIRYSSPGLYYTY